MKQSSGSPVTNNSQQFNILLNLMENLLVPCCFLYSCSIKETSR